jgi:hypothetical protein
LVACVTVPGGSEIAPPLLFGRVLVASFGGRIILRNRRAVLEVK